MMSEQPTQRQISSTAEATRREIHRLHPPRLGSIGVYWPFHFEILLKQKSFSDGECLQAKGSQHVWLERIAKAGGSNDQISAQVCDAGNVPDGADRCALIHSSFCVRRRWSRRKRSPCRLAALGPAAFAAFVVPEAVGHQSHPQDQEEH